MTSAPSHAGPTRHGWIVSLLFWLCLLLAAAMYGMVALAPKYSVYLELQSAHRAGQVRLVALERQVRTLAQVADALETDPEFVAELARVDLDAEAPGEERIAVAPEHRLDAGAGSPAALPDFPLSRRAALVRVFAEDRPLRQTLLASAAAIVIAAFTLLHDSPRRGASFARFVARYRRDCRR